MDRFLSLLSILLIAVGHAAAILSPQQVYWSSVLPNTPMPSSISDHIQPGLISLFQNGKPVVFNVDHRLSVNGFIQNGKPVVFNVGHRLTVNGFRPPYNRVAPEIQLDPRLLALFFLEKDLRPGTEMLQLLTKTISGAAPFLTKKEAGSIPFSSSKLPEILNLLSVKPGSADAETLKQSLQDCEDPAIEGKRRYCATSLESLVEFIMSVLGTREVKAMSTTLDKEGAPQQNYTITGVKALAEDTLVVCHPISYAYAVFFCHTTKATAYTVGMVGADGVVAEAVAVCHTDTKAWNPNHVALKVLKVKPGYAPICHFLQEDEVAWGRSSCREHALLSVS